MKTLKYYTENIVGKTIRATNANDYSLTTGKCVAVRECIESYTEISKGIRHLADVETPSGLIRVCLANTAEIVEQ